MPIYEYLCQRCKTEFELMRSFSESDKPAKCPRCNAGAQKLVSSFGSKTASYIQVSAKPFRPMVAERVKRPKKSTRTGRKKLT